MPTIAVYVPAGAFRTLHEDKILVRGIARKAVEDAAAKLVAQGWPEGPVTPKPSAAEKEYATGDPVEAAPLQPGAQDDAWPEAPEITPEDVAPLFVPAATIVEDHFKPDFKKAKKK